MVDLKGLVREVPLALTRTGDICKKNAPSIMTGLGVVGFVATVVVACQETPRAMELMEEERQKQEMTDETGMKAKAKMVVAVAPAYFPAIGIGAATIGCIVGANYVNLKRNAALATACSISAKAFTDYKDEVAQKIGDKGVTEVKDALAKKKIDAEPVPDDSDILDTGMGKTRCFDAHNGRYFWGDSEKLHQIENYADHERLNSGKGYICLNELYEIMNLPEVSYGDLVGWNKFGPHVAFVYTSVLDANDNPVLAFDFVDNPYTDFDSYDV